jgi:hypothetical protein
MTSLTKINEINEIKEAKINEIKEAIQYIKRTIEKSFIDPDSVRINKTILRAKIILMNQSNDKFQGFNNINITSLMSHVSLVRTRKEYIPSVKSKLNLMNKNFKIILNNLTNPAQPTPTPAPEPDLAPDPVPTPAPVEPKPIKQLIGKIPIIREILKPDVDFYRSLIDDDSIIIESLKNKQKLIEIADATIKQTQDDIPRFTDTDEIRTRKESLILQTEILKIYKGLIDIYSEHLIRIKAESSSYIFYAYKYKYLTLKEGIFTTQMKAILDAYPLTNLTFLEYFDSLQIINMSFFQKLISIMIDPYTFCDMWYKRMNYLKSYNLNNYIIESLFSKIRFEDVTFKSYIEDKYSKSIKPHIDRDTKIFKSLRIQNLKLFYSYYISTQLSSDNIHFKQNILYKQLLEEIKEIIKSNDRYIFNYKLIKTLILFEIWVKEHMPPNPLTVINEPYDYTSPLYTYIELVYYKESIDNFINNIRLIQELFTNNSSFKIEDNKLIIIPDNPDNPDERIYYTHIIESTYMNIIGKYAQILTYVKERNDGPTFGIKNINPRYNIKLFTKYSTDIDIDAEDANTFKVETNKEADILSNIIQLEYYNLHIKYFNYPHVIGLTDYNELYSSTKISSGKYDYNYKNESAIQTVDEHNELIETYNLGKINRYYGATIDASDIAKDNECGKVLLEKLRRFENIIIIGNGQSGAGKTSALISLTKNGKTIKGLLPCLSNQLLIDDNGISFNKAKVQLINLYVKLSDKIENKSIIDDANDYLPYNIKLKDDNQRDIEQLEYMFEGQNNEWVCITDGPKKTITMDKIIAESFGIREEYPTKNNPNSSRSHIIVCVTFTSPDKDDENKTNDACIVICDLAGVEDKFPCRLNDLMILDKNYTSKSSKYRFKDDNGNIIIPSESINFDNYFCTNALYNKKVPNNLLLDRNKYIYIIHEKINKYNNIKSSLSNPGLLDEEGTRITDYCEELKTILNENILKIMLTKMNITDSAALSIVSNLLYKNLSTSPPPPPPPPPLPLNKNIKPPYDDYDYIKEDEDHEINSANGCDNGLPFDNIIKDINDFMRNEGKYYSLDTKFEETYKDKSNDEIKEALDKQIQSLLKMDTKNIDNMINNDIIIDNIFVTTPPRTVIDGLINSLAQSKSITIKITNLQQQYSNEHKWLVEQQTMVNESIEKNYIWSINITSIDQIEQRIYPESGREYQMRVLFSITTGKTYLDIEKINGNGTAIYKIVNNSEGTPKQISSSYSIFENGLSIGLKFQKLYTNYKQLVDYYSFTNKIIIQSATVESNRLNTRFSAILVRSGINETHDIVSGGYNHVFYYFWSYMVALDFKNKIPEAIKQNNKQYEENLSKLNEELSKANKSAIDLAELFVNQIIESYKKTRNSIINTYLENIKGNSNTINSRRWQFDQIKTLIMEYTRFTQLEFNCKIRRQEGYMINTTLKEMQKFIGGLLFKSAKIRFNKTLIENDLVVDMKDYVYEYKNIKYNILLFNKSILDFNTEFEKLIHYMEVLQSINATESYKNLLSLLNPMVQNILKMLKLIYNLINESKTYKAYYNLTSILINICFVDFILKLIPNSNEKSIKINFDLIKEIIINLHTSNSEESKIDFAAFLSGDTDTYSKMNDNIKYINNLFTELKQELKIITDDKKGLAFDNFKYINAIADYMKEINSEQPSITKLYNIINKLLNFYSGTGTDTDTEKLSIINNEDIRNILILNTQTKIKLIHTLLKFFSNKVIIYNKSVYDILDKAITDEIQRQINANEIPTPILYTTPSLDICTTQKNKYTNDFDTFYDQDQNNTTSSNTKEFIFKIMTTDGLIPSSNIKGFNIDINKSTIVIFTVINVTPDPERPTNNPPTPPFININKLKLLYNTLTKLNTKNIKIEDKSVSIKGYLEKSNSKIVDFGRAFYAYLMLYPFYEQFKLEKSISFLLDFGLINDPNYDTNLKELIELIESNNATTLLGTVDFDRFTKIRDPTQFYYICDNIDDNLLPDIIYEKNIINIINLLWAEATNLTLKTEEIKKIMGKTTNPLVKSKKNT